MSHKISAVVITAVGAGLAYLSYKEDYKRENGITSILPNRTSGEKAAGYAIAAALIFAGAHLWKHAD